MAPGWLLLALVLLTALAIGLDVAAHRRRSCALRALATQWRMNYHPGDQLRLTPKVLPHMPIPGAANVRVMDLIYGSESQGNGHHYIFSLEYTVGVVGPKRRVVRVANMTESRDRESGASGTTLTLAPEEGDLLEQYKAFGPAT